MQYQFGLLGKSGCILKKLFNMLEAADTNPSDVVSYFSKKNIPICFISPTKTGLNKSILDAITPVKDALHEYKIHDFSRQQQGSEHKVIVNAKFVHEKTIRETKVSLYRPNTKDGDPRLWIYRLNDYCNENNLIGLIPDENEIYIVNASSKAILDSINEESSPLGRLASKFHDQRSVVANELLSKLSEIESRGFIESLRNGTTGIGYTLEELLGIQENSSKHPDYKGIEIKASRKNLSKGKGTNRVNLFSQVPLWKESPVSSGKALLENYGYYREGRKQLYCTLDSIKPNAQGLMLDSRVEEDLLSAIKKQSNTSTDIVYWKNSLLRERLLEKHTETFWVKADVKKVSGKEFFHYHEVVHTKSPIASHFIYLIDDGVVTLDFTISEKGSGVRDHGYLFKIHPKDLDKLMPNPRVYNLLT